MKTIQLSSVIFLMCFLSFQSNAQAPYWNWASTAGGNNSDRANAIIYTADGNLLVTGFFEDSASFESTSLGAVDFGMFIAKYNCNGNLIWAKKVAEADFGIEPQKIFEDSSGNILITGYFGDFIDAGNVSFNTTNTFTSYGSRDIFISKFDANANFIWAGHIGAIEDEKISSGINNENIIIQGSRFSQLIATADSLSDTLTNDFTWHLWAACYNTNGQIQFLTDVAKNTSQMITTGVSLDQNQNFYLSGNYYGKPVIGILPDTAQLSNAGSFTNIYILKFHSDSTGLQRLWRQHIGGIKNDFAQAMDLNEASEILLTGIYADSSFFGNDSGSIVLQSGITVAENFICGYQSNGNLLFAKNCGYSQTGGITTTQIIHDDSLIYLTGKYTGTTAPVFGAGIDSILLEPVKNFFVAAYTDTGTIHWARGSLSSFANGLNGITLDDSGHVYAAGFYTLYCVIDTGATDSLYFLSSGVDDIFIGRLGYLILVEDTEIIDTTFVQDVSTDNSLSVYPNPTSNNLTIDLNQSVVNSTIEVYSITGKKMFSNNLPDHTKKIFLNTSGFMNGTYLIRIKNKENILTSKFKVFK